MDRRSRGFTLVELLLSMAIATLVLTGAMISLNLLTEADVRLTQGMELGVGIDRTLRVIMRDLHYASDVRTNGDRIIITNADDSAVVYERTPASDELHRVVGASEAAAEAAAEALGLGILTAVVLTPRGYLSESDYRSSAIIQGVDEISWWEILDPQGGIIRGVKVRIRYRFSTITRRGFASGILLPKVVPGGS